MSWFERACLDVLWMALAMGGAWTGSAWMYGAAVLVVGLLIVTPKKRK